MILARQIGRTLFLVLVASSLGLLMARGGERRRVDCAVSVPERPPMLHCQAGRILPVRSCLSFRGGDFNLERVTDKGMFVGLLMKNFTGTDISNVVLHVEFKDAAGKIRVVDAPVKQEVWKRHQQVFLHIDFGEDAFQPAKVTILGTCRIGEDGVGRATVYSESLFPSTRKTGPEK